MKGSSRKKPSEDEVYVKTITNTKVIEKRNGTKITRILTKGFDLRPPKRIGWPLVFLIIVLVLIFLVVGIGIIVEGVQGVYEFLKDLLKRFIELFPH